MKAVTFLLAALMIQALGAEAQLPPWLKEPHLKPAVYGRITDSASGLPIGRMRLGLDGRGGGPWSDTTGWYLLWAVPAGAHQVHFYCPTRRAWSGREIAQRALNVQPHTDSVINFRIPATGCKEPPVRTWTAIVRGHYVAEFETSLFTPCEPLERLKDTAYEGLDQIAWVDDFAPHAYKGFKNISPDTSTDQHTQFVRWRASITGPGSYGHMGVGRYQMRVERVFEMRGSRPKDCN